MKKKKKKKKKKKNAKLMKKKNILILGSKGQIGAHLVDFFKQKKNYNISKFDLVLGKAHDLRETSNKNLERKIK